MCTGTLVCSTFLMSFSGSLITMKGDHEYNILSLMTYVVL